MKTTVKDWDLAEGTITASGTFSECVPVERVKERKNQTRLLNPELLPMLRELCKNTFSKDFMVINGRTDQEYQ